MCTWLLVPTVLLDSPWLTCVSHSFVLLFIHSFTNWVEHMCVTSQLLARSQLCIMNPQITFLYLRFHCFCLIIVISSWIYFVLILNFFTEVDISAGPSCSAIYFGRWISIYRRNLILHCSEKMVNSSVFFVSPKITAFGKCMLELEIGNDGVVKTFDACLMQPNWPIET